MARGIIKKCVEIGGMESLRYESRADLGYVKFGDSDISKCRCYVIGYANLKLRGNSYNC